jgi:ATP-binding cassette subfamily B protein
MAMAWRSWPAGVVARVATMFVSQLAAGVGQGYALKRVVETTQAGQPSAWWLGALVLAVWQPWSPGALFNHVQAVLLRMNGRAVAETIAAASLGRAGIDHLEDPLVADRIASLRQRSAELPALFDTTAHVIGSGLAAVVSAVVLARLHPLLVLPLPLAAVLAVVQRRARRRTESVRDQSLPEQRIAAALLDTATSATAAPHVRMHALGPWLMQRHQETTGRVAHAALRGELASVVASAATGASQALILGGSMFYVVTLARAGTLTAGNVALALLLLRAALDAAVTTATGAAGLTSPLNVARQYLWLLELPSPVARPADPVAVPAVLRTGIEVTDVTFAYGSSPVPALCDVTLTLAAGSVVALVGDNGAGKSTLVKLLLRLYDPDHGRIVVDESDLRDFEPDDWRNALAGAFQDFARLEFVMSEAIGVGDLTHIADVDVVAAAAAEGGASDTAKRLPHGLDTQLGPERQDGVQLSTGEWQRVAMSRGSMRRHPLLLILDEPTAALDPRAEHALFERIASHTKATRASGGVTVLVSHRFSTVRMADVIVVMDNGRIVEQGTHDELVALGGRYATTYNLQAQRYR